MNTGSDQADNLVLKCIWEKVHQLGISKLVIKIDTNFLVTLSFDCSCKVLDASTGCVVYHLLNSHNCMYMGATWSLSGHLYLCDELGFLEVFSSQKERNVACLPLLQTGSGRRTENILGEHRDPGLLYVILSASVYVFTLSICSVDLSANCLRKFKISCMFSFSSFRQSNDRSGINYSSLLFSSLLIASRTMKIILPRNAALFIMTLSDA